MTSEAMQDRPAADVARQFVRAQSGGVLSTHSQDVAGYPFGSIIPYALTHEGETLILVSDIAQHTKNMRADARVSLTIVSDESDKQANARVTIVGESHEITGEKLESLSARYYAFFPGHRRYFEAHNFHFYVIAPVRVRYIGGFGDIHWIEPEAWLLPTPEWRDGEQGAIEHMNADHQDSLRNMLQHQLDIAEAAPELIAIDREGFHVRGDEDRLHYLKFPQPCETREDLHQHMVALAREARTALAQ